MKKYSLLILLASLFLYQACATTASTSDRTTNEAMLNFLPYLNQKVAGYLDINGSVALDADTYKKIIDEVCVPLPSCGKNAAIMFDSYSVQPRKLDDAFSVMLCDNDGATKIMEDFSCNEQKVEITNYQTDTNAPCKFEDNWREKVAPYCPATK